MRLVGNVIILRATWLTARNRLASSCCQLRWALLGRQLVACCQRDLDHTLHLAKTPVRKSMNINANVICKRINRELEYIIAI